MGLALINTGEMNMCLPQSKSSINVRSRYNLSTTSCCHYAVVTSSYQCVKGGVINLHCMRGKTFSPERGLCPVIYDFFFFSPSLISVG